MKSRKKLICLAVAASLVMGAAFSGCTALLNEADVKQTIAVVNITGTDAFKKEFGDKYKDAVKSKVFLKRDMLTAFYNSYYQYTQTGSSYEQVFNQIKDDLVAGAVNTQYATVYLLKKLGDDALTTYLAYETEAEKHEYILNEYDAKAVARAKYSLNSNLNAVLDSAERALLKDEEDDDEYKGEGTRATPTGLNTTVEDYIPENYNVYTGYEGYLLPEGDVDKAVKNGDYEPLDGTTKVTRQKAYASFLNSLKSNYLLTEEDTKTTDIWKLSYVQDAYVSQLQSEIISVFQEEIKKEQEEKISETEGGIYTYVEKQYENLLDTQKKNYSDKDAFESAMGSMSDTSFILYSPSTEDDTEEINGAYGTFGYVYNILLPFSTMQEQQLGVLKSDRDDKIITESGYFYERNKLLKKIETTDQRAAWFNGTTDYSFDVTKYNEGKENADKLGYFAHAKANGDTSHDYLFFEEHMTDPDNAQYESLERYDGRYSYNGTVKPNKNGSYTLIPKKLTIEDMLTEFSAYINYVLGNGTTPADSVEVVPNAEFYTTTDFTKAGEEKEIDYEKLVYATGHVSLGANADRKDMFDVTTDRYKVMAAVNELQYAYTTDTGVLSQYIGYTVSAYDTSYIKEFEYAAQQAVREGVGHFAVCAGDYGWHLIYVTEKFDFAGGNVYTPEWTAARIEKEGTFENRFYNWIKDTHLAKEVTLKSNTVSKEYNTEKAVTVYTDAYKDLSELN